MNATKTNTMNVTINDIDGDAVHTTHSGTASAVRAELVASLGETDGLVTLFDESVASGRTRQGEVMRDGERYTVRVVVSSVDAEDVADIDAIAKLLTEAGPTFSGGSDDSALVAAREWGGCDFTLDGVRLWVAAEVWTPSVADALDAAGVIPRKLVAAVGSEAIYATCNGDMAVADLIAAYEAE